MLAPAIDQNQSTAALLDELRNLRLLVRIEGVCPKVAENDEVKVHQFLLCLWEHLLNHARDAGETIVESRHHLPPVVTFKVILQITRLPARPSVEDKHAALPSQQMDRKLTRVVVGDLVLRRIRTRELHFAG